MIFTAKACLSLALLSYSQHQTGRAVAFAWSSSRSNLYSRIITPVSSNFQRNNLAAAAQFSMASTADVDIASNIAHVSEQIQSACDKAGRSYEDVRLVAVSKTKPIELLKDAYENGNQRIFGENYVQELIEKVPQMAEDVQWHFIGALQSNKANVLVKSICPTNKLVVETVSSLKLANKLNNAMATVIEAKGEESTDEKLDIFIQINTSGEESKSGIEPDQVVQLCNDIIGGCSHLNIMGLMTIGAPGDFSCFDTLVACRETVAKEVDGLSLEKLELSMGMSGDYEQAILQGATNVRVGSTIFGARDYSNKK